MKTKPSPELVAATRRLRLTVERAGLRATAREMGLSPSYVSEILGGTRKLGKKAQKALGIS